MPRKSAAPKSYKAVDNLGLAYKVCKRYQPTGEIEDSEVLSDAYLALFRAEKHFDPKKGFKFSTYAWSCIAKEVVGGLKKRQTNEIHDDNETIYKILDYRPHKYINHINNEHNKMIVTQIFALLEEDSTMIISSDMLKEYYFEGKTYKEIGQKYGYTKQRIQQKIVDTIEYIKSHEKFKEIKSLTYYNE